MQHRRDIEGFLWRLAEQSWGYLSFEGTYGGKETRRPKYVHSSLVSSFTWDHLTDNLQSGCVLTAKDAFSPTSSRACCSNRSCSHRSTIRRVFIRFRCLPFLSSPVAYTKNLCMDKTFAIARTRALDPTALIRRVLLRQDPSPHWLPRRRSAVRLFRGSFFLKWT